MSAFGGKVDMPLLHVSAFAPKRTLDLSPTRSCPAHIGVCFCKILWKPIAARDLSKGKNRQVKKAQLRVRRVVHVPLREVSGICLRRSRNSRMSLIAVGDRAAKIAWFSQPRSDEGQIDWHTRSIAKLSGSKLPKRDPQIEAVCADGGGRILLLQETPARVELIDLEALEPVALIHL